MSHPRVYIAMRLTLDRVRTLSVMCVGPGKIAGAGSMREERSSPPNMWRACVDDHCGGDFDLTLGLEDMVGAQ